MAVGDRPAWTVFRDELNEWMRLRKMGNSELSNALGAGITTDQVRHWTRGPTKPDISLIPRISKALGMGGPRPGHDDPTYILRKMGLLVSKKAGDLADLSVRTQQLELRRQALLSTVGRLERGQMVVEMVRTAHKSGEWAVSVRPSIAGPADCRLHVADQIELSRVDGSSVTHQEVFNDDLWHELALRGRVELPDRIRRSSNPASPTWILSALAVPTEPLIREPHEGLRGLCLYGLTRDSGVNQIAYLMAAALGYGFTSTRALVLETTILEGGYTSWAERLMMHHRLLESPKERTVWSHHAPPHPDDGPDPFEIAASDVPIVWLREHEDVLKRYCSRWEGATLKAHVDFRNRCNQLADKYEGKVRVIDVNWSEDPDEKWAAMLNVTKQLLATTPYRDALRSAETTWLDASLTDREVSAPFLAWLRKDPKVLSRMAW